MRMIAGAIVTFSGAILWGLASLNNSDTGMVACVGGMFLTAVGLAVLFGFVPRSFVDSLR